MYNTYPFWPCSNFCHFHSFKRNSMAATSHWYVTEFGLFLIFMSPSFFAFVSLPIVVVGGGVSVVVSLSFAAITSPYHIIEAIRCIRYCCRANAWKKMGSNKPSIKLALCPTRFDIWWRWWRVFVVIFVVTGFFFVVVDDDAKRFVSFVDFIVYDTGVKRNEEENKDGVQHTSTKRGEEGIEMTCNILQRRELQHTPSVVKLQIFFIWQKKFQGANHPIHCHVISMT